MPKITPTIQLDVKDFAEKGEPNFIPEPIKEEDEAEQEP